MAVLTTQIIVETGLNPSLVAAAAGGDEIVFDDSERTFLRMDNGDASPHTVTITAQKTSLNVPGWGDVIRGDMVVVVPAGETRLIGPFPVAFADPANSNRVQVTYDAETSVTVAAIRLPKA